MKLAEKIGIIQTIVSVIEKGALKLSAEMADRFAFPLGISTDDPLMPAKKKMKSAKPSRKVRRVEEIKCLPAHHQQTVLKSIDMM